MRRVTPHSFWVWAAIAAFFLSACSFTGPNKPQTTEERFAAAEIEYGSVLVRAIALQELNQVSADDQAKLSKTFHQYVEARNSALPLAKAYDVLSESDRKTYERRLLLMQAALVTLISIAGASP